MSHEIVKSITIKDDKVYLTSADSSLRPLHFNRWECEPLSQILAEQGREAVLAAIGKDFWDGNLHLYKGSKLCNLFLEARIWTNPKGLNFMTYDSKAAGEFLARMVMKLEKDPCADLSPVLHEMLSKMNDRDYILEAAQRTGHNFLNQACPDVQKDKAFALEVLRAGNGAAWFDYPTQYKDNKEFALEAVKLNGCFYRQLGDDIKADREVIIEAFRESAGKAFHEHLPDIIPPRAFFDFEADPLRPTLDKKFIMDLLDSCPSMHMHRLPFLLRERDIALKWTQVGKFFPYSVSDLPKEYLMDKEFQDTLCKRFEDTDQYDVLVKLFEERGVQLNKRSLAEQIQSASTRAANVRSNSDMKIKESEPEL